MRPRRRLAIPRNQNAAMSSGVTAAAGLSHAGAIVTVDGNGGFQLASVKISPSERGFPTSMASARSIRSALTLSRGSSFVFRARSRSFATRCCCDRPMKFVTRVLASARPDDMSETRPLSRLASLLSNPTCGICGGMPNSAKADMIWRRVASALRSMGQSGGSCRRCTSAGRRS